MFVGILSLLAGLIGLAAAAMLYKSIVRLPTGDELMTAIGEEIQFGASLAFLAGALTSALAGLVGMIAATKANVRTTCCRP